MAKPTTGLKNKYSRLFFAAFILFSSLFIGQPAAAEPTLGLTQDVYVYDPASTPDRKEYTLCNTSVVPNMNFDVGDGVVANCQQDFVLIHWTGYMTLPISGEVTFQSLADDGFYLNIGGATVIDDWSLKGCGGNAGVATFESGVSQKIDVWWYEYGGGACNYLYYTDPATGFNLVPDSAFTTEVAVPVEPPHLNPPTGVQVSINENTAKVSWNAPEDTGVAVEHYALSWTYDGQAGWGVSVWGNEYVITGLPENKEVTFWVRSDNDSLSIYSASSETVTAKTGIIPIEIVKPPVEPEPPVKPELPKVVEEPVTPEPPVVVPKKPEVVKPKPVEDLKHIPAVIENLMQINLELVKPEELTEAQAEQLVEAAIAVFETATEGSPEYEQALDALYLASEQDDIVVDEELANTPVIGAAVVAIADAINFFGNIGSDISPEVREKSKKVVVGSIVLGQIAQAAGMASISRMNRNGK